MLREFIEIINIIIERGGNPRYQAALDSGMSITDCLALVLAGKQPDQNVPAKFVESSGDDP